MRTSLRTGHDASAGITVLVCLPAGSSTGPVPLAVALADRWRHWPPPGRPRPCPHHLPVPDPLPSPLRRLLYAARPHLPGEQTAAAAPVGLLDPTGYRNAIDGAAQAIHTEWCHTVTGTGPAQPWRSFLNQHLTDPDRNPLEQVWNNFSRQPRIAAMLAAERAGISWFIADQYGPGLSAHQHGQPRLAGYIADVVQLGDALLAPDGRLLAATDPLRPRVAHTLSERDAYHAAARQLLARLDPDTVITTVHITH
jgi:hypothetical protein